MGKVDRGLLQSFYQNKGDLYDDEKTEGAFGVLADQIDANDDEVVAINNTVNDHLKKQVDPTSDDMTRDKHVSNKDLKDLWEQKTDKNGDHQGTWQGLRPSDLDSGQQALDLQRLEDELNTLEDEVAAHLADYVKHPGYAAATGDDNVYHITLDPEPDSYVDGMGVVFKVDMDSTGAASLNVNGLGDVPIKTADGEAVEDLKAGGVYTVRYNNGNFILQGSGGGAFRIEFENYSTIDAVEKLPSPVNLSVSRRNLASASIGKYALFGGGEISGGYTGTVDVYDSSLVRTTATALGRSRGNLAGASNSNYALFAGGYTGALQGQSDVDAYNASLVRTSPTGLTQAKGDLASVSTDQFAIFAGGGNPYLGYTHNTVDSYNNSLSKTTLANLSKAVRNLAGSKTKNYILFAGGSGTDGDSNTVDVYSRDTLSKLTPVTLSSPRRHLVGGETKNHALFAGGYSGGQALSEVDIFDDSLTRTTTNLTVATYYLASASVNGYCFFAGGSGTNMVNVFDEGLVRILPEGLTGFRPHLAGGVVAHYVLFSGGGSSTSGSTTVDAYATKYAEIQIPPQSNYKFQIHETEQFTQKGITITIVPTATGYIKPPKKLVGANV